MNATTHQCHISRRPQMQSHMRTIQQALSCWSDGYPPLGTGTGRLSAGPRVPYRRLSWSVRRRPRRRRSAIDRKVWRCWPREHDVAVVVEAGMMHCAAPFWRRRRGIGPVSTAIPAWCYRARSKRYSLKPSPRKGSSANKRHRARRDLG
jgi:hypothetical protein